MCFQRNTYNMTVIRNFFFYLINRITASHTWYSIRTAKIPAPIDFRSFKVDTMTILIALNANKHTDMHVPTV